MLEARAADMVWVSLGFPNNDTPNRPGYCGHRVFLHPHGHLLHRPAQEAEGADGRRRDLESKHLGGATFPRLL